MRRRLREIPWRAGLGHQCQRIAGQRFDSPAGFSAGGVENADSVAWLDENGELLERRGDTLRLDGSSAGAESKNTAPPIMRVFTVALSGA